MFRCAICQQSVPPHIPAQRIVLEWRRRTYPFRSDANPRAPKDSRQRHDPGGVGYEIAREVLACPACAARHRSAVPTAADDPGGGDDQREAPGSAAPPARQATPAPTLARSATLIITTAPAPANVTTATRATAKGAPRA